MILCGFYSKLGYCEEMVEEFGGGGGGGMLESWGGSFPPVDETMAGHVSLLSLCNPYMPLHYLQFLYHI